jgi:hypothetical protein
METAVGVKRSLPAAVTGRLDAVSNFKIRWWTPVVVGLMMMGDSWDLTVAGFVMPSLRHEWSLPAGQVGSPLNCTVFVKAAYAKAARSNASAVSFGM